MKTLLHVIVCGLVLLGAGRGAVASDVPLTGAPVSFGPGHLDVVVGGVGLATQPATFAVDVPAGASVVAAYLYLNGRGAGDGDGSVLVNGAPLAAPLAAQSGFLPVEPCERIETRRIELTDGLALAAGTNTFTIDGYEQCTPGGAFVVAVISHPSAPMRTIDILEGADYAYHGFAAPFGPDTEVGSFGFAATAESRDGHLVLFTHDTEADRTDAIWTLAGSSSVPTSLISGANGATLLEIDRLGVPTASGGYGVGASLDIVSEEVAIPSGSDFLAFQVESPDDGSGESLGLSVAVLALPTGDGGGGPTGEGTCGDHVVNSGEACDDGNLAGGDGCSETCAVEPQSKTIDAIIRVRKHRRERVWYFAQLPGLSSELVGTSPVHVTLLANGHTLLDLEVPVKAWQRVEPRATNAIPTGKFAAAAQGTIGDVRLRYMRLWPLGEQDTYNLKFKVKREMLKRPGGITKLTSIIRVGDEVFTTTDPMIVRRKGKIVRNAGN